MKCRNCGFELDEGALFCRKCGTAVPEPNASEPKARAFRLPDLSAFFGNKKRMVPIGVGAAVLLALILILSLVSCGGKKTRFQTAEETFAAAVEALEAGDGERLYQLTQASETVLGAHPEIFGEGNTPAAVMKGYYARLAGEFKAKLDAYGGSYELLPLLETETLTGSQIFEANRTLNLDAEAYASASGALSVNGETAANVYLVAAHFDGAWELLAVYLY